MRAKKAIVLAAGLGTRLRPFTCITPKPLMPVWGEPMLARIVATLRAWGVEEIVVNSHHLHNQVDAWCAANGCRVSHEPEILGTGGVLNPLRAWLAGDDFYLVNGDIVVEGVDECPFDGGASSSADVIGQCLVTEEGPRTVEVEPDRGLVTCWHSPDAGCRGTFTYCGVALLSPAILDYVAPAGFSSIIDAYEKASMEGRFVKAISPGSLLWSDLGTVDSYMEVNRSGEENAYAYIPQVKAAVEAISGRAVAPGEIEFLGARGSDRCFFRLGGKAVAIVYDDAKRAENAKYASHARWLKAKGVPVPEVFADLPEQKTLVLEWAGLERKMSLDEYAKVVAALAKFNALDASGLDLEPAFGPDLYKWERDLFAEHCLGARFAMECPKAVAVELEAVAEKLAREPVRLVHRDFQSTNVLWRNAEFGIIDFQGMRLGPAVYDLASLLYDPYVEMSEKARSALAALYGKESGRPEVPDVLPFAAVERLVQALGAYGRLASVGQTGFSRYVMPALENLLSAADEAGLDATGALAEDLLAKEQSIAAHSCSCGENDHQHHQEEME